MKNAWLTIPKRTAAGRLTVAMLIVLMVVGSASLAEEFVSFNGKFRISVPEGWKQADYRTVDYYLQRGASDDQALRYEAVFSPFEGGHFADGAYLILTVDTVGEMNPAQIDSLLFNLGDSFGTDVKRHSLGQFDSDLNPNQPVYDAAQRTAAVVSEISDEAGVYKKNFLVIKFYEHGITNFYFYAPDSLFDESLPVFAAVVTSFSTENLEAAIPKQEVKVADLESLDKKERSYWLPLAAGVICILAIVIFATRARRRKS